VDNLAKSLRKTAAVKKIKMPVDMGGANE